MHDFDRTQAEYESLVPELGAYEHEFPGEGEQAGEWEGEGEYERYGGDSPFSEGEEMELAAELLDVRNEQELDHFLGNLINKVGKGISGFANSSVGKALGGVLKQAAKAALPLAGTALGTFVGGPAGGMLGGKLASAAGDMFGLELEGLSGEDREFETARQFVRFAGHAAKHAARSPRGSHPRHMARSAIINAAQHHAPGLFQKMSAGRPGAAPQSGMPGGGLPGASRFPAGYFGGAPGGYPPTNGDGSGPDSMLDGDGTADDQGFDGADGNADGSGDPGDMGPAGPKRRGTWVRRGRRIILFGA